LDNRSSSEKRPSPWAMPHHHIQRRSA
jgi:hypothetical protein